MSVSARSHTRFAAALMAAGVVSAASVVSIPEHRWAPTISADVANTSVITDTLYSLGKGVEVLSSTVGIHVDATISLPFEATLAVLTAARNPAGPHCAELPRPAFRQSRCRRTDSRISMGFQADGRRPRGSAAVSPGAERG